MLFKRKQKPAKRQAAEKQPSVFSYYAQARSDNVQNVGRSEDSLLINNQSRLSQLPTYLAGFVLLAALLYSLWLQPKPKIIILNQTGTIHHSASAYQHAIDDLWQKSLLNRTKLTVHSRDLNLAIRQAFPELSNVEIDLPLLAHRPTVVLTPGSPAMELINNQGSFYLDNNGRVLGLIEQVEANQLSPIPVVQDNSDLSASVGANILPVTHVKFLIQLFAYLKAAHVSIESMDLSTTVANEVDVHVSGQGFYLKFDLLGDPKEAVGSYLVVKNNLARDHITPGQYIDLRVSEKVFYK